MSDNSEISKPKSCSEPEPHNTAPSNPTTHEIVERYLPQVEWTSEIRGRAPCPGKHKHTTKSHRNDCWVFINGTPTVSCLHDNCREEVAAVNSNIRSAWSLFQPPLDEAAMSEAREKAAQRHSTEAKAKASLPEILKQFKWDILDIEISSKFRGAYNGQSTDIFLEKMFEAEDVLWIGDPENTGQERYASHFKKREDWTTNFDAWVYGNYTCASTFKPGTYSRANANVLTTPYLITEGDNVLGIVPETDEQKLANKNASGAVARWLQEKVGLTLRAVVDSGNKSLHFWWEMPKKETFEELRIILPCLGFDRAMFKPSQPARLAGVIRDNGNEQKLLYIK